MHKEGCWTALLPGWVGGYWEYLQDCGEDFVLVGNWWEWYLGMLGKPEVERFLSGIVEEWFASEEPE